MFKSTTALLATAFIALLTPTASGAGHGGCNWPMYGHDLGHSFSQSTACTQINTTSVVTLTERWFFGTGDHPVTASTTVVNGIAYVGDWSGKFHAIDARTGEELWNFQVDDAQNSYPGKIVSSAAVDTIRVGAASIRVLVFGGAATLYVLNPVDGTLLAKQDLDPRANPDDSGEIEIESSPAIAHLGNGSDRIFVGMDVHNDANVGRTGLHSFELLENPGGLTPYRLQLVFKFDPETRIVRTSISEGAGEGRGCAGIWSSPVVDTAALDGDGLVVFGTSNCVNPAGSSGEAESEGIYAIRATTGALVWEFHPRLFNNVDDDFGASANLLPGGLVGNGGKDGFYYAFDRVTGAPAAAWLGPDQSPGTGDDGRSHPAQSGHLSDQFAFGGIIGTPAVGAVDGEAAIFIASALSTPIGAVGPPPEPDPTLADDPERMLSLHAISAVDGRILWRSATARSSFGAPTYANGIVFVPSTFGLSLQAYDANTGVLLAAREVGGAPSSSPTVVGNTVFIGTGTTADPVPNASQLHGLHAFSIPEAPVVPGAGILLSPHANELNAYDLAAAAPTTTRSTPVPAHSSSEFGTAPPGSGNDVNGQNCAITQADGSVRYVMGEDSNQGNDVADPNTDNPDRDGDGEPGPSGEYQGWGLFVPTFGTAGAWTLMDKLVPTYNFTDPPNDHLPDNTGCAVSLGSPDPADDLLFLVDLGVGAFDVPGVGSLFAFYRDAAGNFSHDSKFCALDNHLTTAGYLAVDDDGSVLVPQSGRSSGGEISRYSAPFPPATGASCSYNLAARKSVFIQDTTSFVPISIARRGDKWVVGNVVPAVLNEYNLDGTFARPLVTEQPTPGVAGIAIDAPGNVYWANLGLAPCDTILCPVDGLGTLWKLSFDPVTDAPLAPVLLQPNLTFPEGMGIADPLPEPPRALGAAASVLALAALHRIRGRRVRR